MYLRWMADNMWLFVPVQDVVGEFFKTLPEYPMQRGTAMNPASLNYDSLKMQEKLQQLDKVKQEISKFK